MIIVGSARCIDKERQTGFLFLQVLVTNKQTIRAIVALGGSKVAPKSACSVIDSLFYRCLFSEQIGTLVARN